MSKARLVLTALFVDRQPPAEVAARYGVHRSWVYKLKARYHTTGEAAFEPRSRRPKTSPTAIPAATVALIIELRGKLTTAGLDAGPDTIAWHLAHHHDTTVSASTISRYLTRSDPGGQACRQATWNDLADTAGGGVDPGHSTSRLEARIHRPTTDPDRPAVGRHPFGAEVEPSCPQQSVAGGVDASHAVAALGDPDDAAGDRNARGALTGELNHRDHAVAGRIDAGHRTATGTNPSGTRPTATSDGRKRRSPGATWNGSGPSLILARTRPVPGSSRTTSSV
jgi:hypothetical protein